MRRAVAVGVAIAALAFAAPANADYSRTVRPHGSLKLNENAKVVSAHAGGVRLTRVCIAGGSVCRYFKPRPRSACRVTCPLIAAWRTYPSRMLNRSDYRLRLRLRAV